MPNAIKYNVSAETLALKKGNFWIGTGDVGKGPTSSTGFYNGITPPSGGYTIYLNKASDGPSIYTVSNESELTGLTNTISVSTNLIKNNNGGNFANGTIAPFTNAYGTLPTIVDITNDKPYNGSTSTKAAKFVAGGGMLIYTDPSPFTMTVGVTYTFSFWYRQTNANQFNIGFNNQGGSGDINGNFQSYSLYGYFSNPTQSWQRCSWTFTNVVDKVYFIINSMSSAAGSECLMTEFTLTEGSMPGGPGLTTSGNCLNWFSTQTDKMIFNRDYESIVTSGLTLNLDAGFSPSFATIPLNANNSTVTPWYDLSGNGNNGTLTNGPTYSSTSGGSIVFDGVDDYTQLNQTITLTGEFTLNLFILPTSTNTKILLGNNGGDYLQINNSSALGLFSSTEFITLNGYSWDVSKPSMVTVTRNSSNVIQTYKNGDSSVTGSLTGDFRIRQIGQRGNSSRFYQGSIYTIQIYNRALTAAEINQNYNAQKGRFGL
jgi:hypothetical protein